MSAKEEKSKKKVRGLEKCSSISPADLNIVVDMVTCRHICCMPSRGWALQNLSSLK